jgi:hypothetical protein
MDNIENILDELNGKLFADVGSKQWGFTCNIAAAAFFEGHDIDVGFWVI